MLNKFFKRLRGEQVFRKTAASKVNPDSSKYSEEQIRWYQKTSASIDICTNTASWLVFTNDEKLPVTEYVVALEGSVEMLSHWAQISNMVEDCYRRPQYQADGQLMRFHDSNKIMYYPPGSFKRTLVREDCKMRLVNVVADLAVEKPDSRPFKTMRFPVENGNAIQKVIISRSAILQSKVINCLLQL